MNLRRSGSMLTCKRIITGTVLMATLAACPRICEAQKVEPKSFEVATIKPSDPGKSLPPYIRFLSDRFEARNTSLRSLIATAYGLNYDAEQQIIGGPSWIRSEQFDVVAKEDGDLQIQIHNLPTDQQGDINRQMIQQLLVDRFALKVHREQKILTAYTLEVVKGGPKLSAGVLDPHLSANIPQARINMMGVGSLAAHNADMTLFAKVLSSRPEIGGRTIVDGTGLKGKYDFTLRWMPNSNPDGPASESPSNAASESLPSLFDALQNQLGLKLTSKKQPIEVVVIDSIELPSVN